MTDANATVVHDFLTALAEPDIDRCRELLDPEVEWRNTGLPSLKGKRVGAALASMAKCKIGFDVDFHDITGTGDRVSTRRTDYLSVGPVRQKFKVNGDFVVREGRILLWDDHFSWPELMSSTRLLRRSRARTSSTRGS